MEKGKEVSTDDFPKTEKQNKSDIPPKMKINMSNVAAETPSTLRPSLSSYDSSIYHRDEEVEWSNLFKLRIVQLSKEMKTRVPKKLELMRTYKGIVCKLFYTLYVSQILYIYYPVMVKLLRK